jgi:TonB family protein
MNRTSSRRLSKWYTAGLLLAVGCSSVNNFIFPPRFERISLLHPQAGHGERYTESADGAISYELEGLRIEVEHMSDPELNKLFPQESSQGKYSINPYTYGDYVDPAVGYVHNRLTVFRVTVHNTSFAKVQLQPLRSLLTTEREGEVLRPYGVQVGAAPQTFEAYYRALQGPSGNEDYRFNMRMGIVRTNNYTIDENVFKGEDYGGYIAFAPLDDEVEEVRLLLQDFILKFNAFDKPLEIIDVEFRFDRTIDQRRAEGESSIAELHETTRASLGAATRVVGNVTGDVTRDVTAVEGQVRGRLGAINRCFAREFDAGRASEGEITAQFVILPDGTVQSAKTLRSTVVSDAVGECIVDLIRRWRFRPSTGLASQEEEAPDVTSLQTSAARVTATCFFEFIDVREK